MNRIYYNDSEAFLTDEQLEKLDYLHAIYESIGMMIVYKNDDHRNYEYSELEKKMEELIIDLQECGLNAIFLDEMTNISIDDDWKKSYERGEKINKILDEKE